MSVVILRQLDSSLKAFLLEAPETLQTLSAIVSARSTHRDIVRAVSPIKRSWWLLGMVCCLWGTVASATNLSSAAQSQSSQSVEVEHDQSLREFVRQNGYRQAYGMYLQKQKLGWVIEEMQLGQHKGQEVAVYQDESYFSTEFLGEKEVSTGTSRVVFSLEGDGAIVYAKYVNVEDGRETTIECIAEGDQIVVTTQAGGEVSTRRVSMPKDTLRESKRFHEWLTGDRKSGDQIETWSADFEESDVDVPERYAFDRAYQLMKDGETLDLVDVEMEILGGQGELTLTRKGRLIRGKLSGFIELVAEDELTIKTMDGELVDLFAVASIQIDSDLGDPRHVTELVLNIRNEGSFTFPESHRQRVVINEDGSQTLTLQSEHQIDQPEPLGAEERQKYLAATPATSSDHPTMVERAKRIISAEEDPRKQIERIMRWVYLNMDAASASNSTNALQILEQRAGDCSEHALLCVALARAVGIPAREVSGVMYGGDGSKMFAWHAWVEMHDGHQWIEVDPTWNQTEVDATHLKLSHGSRDLSWTNVIGKLEVEVTHVKSDERKKN